MITEILFFLILTLFFSAGVLSGIIYEHAKMMRRLKKVAEEFKPMCGNCTHYDGSWCTKDWNNMDKCYLDRDRDDKDPEDEACEDWEFDPDWETY